MGAKTMAKKQPQVKFLGIKTTKKGKKILIIITIFLGLILIDLYSPTGGNLRFASEWMRCGHRPYIEDGLPGWGVRFYSPAPDLAMGRNYIEKYYCTPIDAERDGLSGSQDVWDFPHLDAVGEPWPI